MPLYNPTGAGTVTGVTAADTSIVIGGTGAAPTVATGTLDVIATDHPPAASVAMNGKTLTNAGAGAVTLPWLGGMFGDGSDGSVTFDGSTTILGMVPSSSIYTMTRDIFCTSITINSGVTIIPAGWRIFCAGAMSIVGTGSISAVGGNASGTNNGTAGAATGTGTLGGGRAGGGGQTTTGSAGTASNGVGTGAPGAGGNGTNAGGAGAGAPPSTGVSWLRTPGTALATALFNSSAVQRLDGGGGGSGGGGDGTNKGGGGGGGGGVVVIFAWSLANAGTITVAGGNGGSPSTVQTNQGVGGGGAGSGGIVLIYTLSAVTGAGSVSVAAGGIGTGTHNGSGSSTNGGTGAAGTYLNVVLA